MMAGFDGDGPRELHPCFWRTAGTLGRVYRRAGPALPAEVAEAYRGLLAVIRPYFLPSKPFRGAGGATRPEVEVFSDLLCRVARRGDSGDLRGPSVLLRLDELVPAGPAPVTPALAPGLWEACPTPPRVRRPVRKWVPDPAAPPFEPAQPKPLPEALLATALEAFRSDLYSRSNHEREDEDYEQEEVQALLVAPAPGDGLNGEGEERTEDGDFLGAVLDQEEPLTVDALGTSFQGMDDVDYGKIYGLPKLSILDLAPEPDLELEDCLSENGDRHELISGLLEFLEVSGARSLLQVHAKFNQFDDFARFLYGEDDSG